MKKKTKVITNQVSPAELKAKVEAVEEQETPQEDFSVLRDPKVTPPTVPEEDSSTPLVSEKEDSDTESDLEEIRTKDPNELTNEEWNVIEENKDKLTAEEKETFHVEEPVVTVTPPTTPPDETDWKARYAGSTREAQVLAARNKQITETVEKANALSEPTEEEMEKEVGDDWEIMDETQKKIAKQASLANRRFEMIHEATMASRKVDEWMDKVRTFSKDPQITIKYPKLDGKELEFEQFCAIPSRVGVDLDDLVKAFTFDIKPEVSQRKSLFERGTGGQAPPVKALTVEEISFLRTHDNRKYKELLKAGKIKIEV